MKKIGMVILLVVCVIGFSSLAVTQEIKCPMMEQGKKVTQPQKMAPMMPPPGMPPCCGMMAGRSLVALEDGGVVVMCCNKLYKYDSNLVLQKEVELKMDMVCPCPLQKAGKCPLAEQMKKEAATKAQPKK